nr:MAG TPA: hypothetical protein [Caudoviricetes sp.]
MYLLSFSFFYYSFFVLHRTFWSFKCYIFFSKVFGWRAR